MKGERRRGKEKGEIEREQDFSLGNHNCGTAPSIGYHCAPFAKGRGKEKGKENGKRRKVRGKKEGNEKGNRESKNPCIDGATLKHIGNTFWA